MANRMMRADNEIIKVISDIVLNKLRDPRLSKFITITRAKTSPDFRFCRVGVSVLSDSINEKKETLKLLKKSSGYIKRQMAIMLDMPNIPDLVFELDDNVVYSERINDILSTLYIPKEESDETDNKED